jgi:acyl carrier protein
MSTENWTPLTHEQVEKRFIEMINDYMKMDLQYPIDPTISLKDIRLIDNDEVAEMTPEMLELAKQNLQIDSIDILELVIQIEEEFGCVIDDKEIATLLQWGDLIGYITDSQDPTKIKKK